MRNRYAARRMEAARIERREPKSEAWTGYQYPSLAASLSLSLSASALFQDPLANLAQKIS
jgi:hypothetical protein